MTTADKLFEHHDDAERVIGTYLYPIYYFGTQNPTDPYAAAEIICSLSVDPVEVQMTRMSGLFVRPPTELSDLYENVNPPTQDWVQKLAFVEEAAQAFNRIICELCLRGIVSQPTSAVHISYAQLRDAHTLITIGHGAREVYWERTLAPGLALLGGNWLTWQTRSPDTLEASRDLARSSRLAEISSTLPELVAGAYSLYSQRQINEALVDAWVVSEQLLDDLWDQHLAEIADGPRKQRLGDARTYTANVRLEVLRTVGVLAQDLYEALHTARIHRNELAHRAKNSLEATRECMTAMTMTLERVLQEKVAEASVSLGLNW